MEFDGARADVERARQFPLTISARIKLSLGVKCPSILKGVEALEASAAGQAVTTSLNLAGISGSKKFRCGCLAAIAATTFP